MNNDINMTGKKMLKVRKLVLSRFQPCYPLLSVLSSVVEQFKSF